MGAVRLPKILVRIPPAPPPCAGAKSMGEGDLWNALALYAKRVSVEVTHQGKAPERVLGPVQPLSRHGLCGAPS